MGVRDRRARLAQGVALPKTWATWVKGESEEAGDRHRGLNMALPTVTDHTAYWSG